MSKARLKKNNKLKKVLFKPNYLVIILTLILVVFGIIMVTSASIYTAEIHYSDKFYFTKKQILGAVIGLIGMCFFCFYDYRKLAKFNQVAIIVSVLVLIAVFIPGLGVANYGAKRWIGLGAFTIQASEIAKFGFILFASASLAKNFSNIKSFKSLLPTIISGVIICVLIIMEPNMSITMCVGITMFVMLFVGGAKFRHLALILVPALLAVPALIIMEPYRLKRLAGFLDPWASPLSEGYQLIQSLYSLGSGGLFGVGVGNSRQKFLFLPFSESDFIFAIIGEELGFVGAIVLIAVYFLLIMQGIKIAKKAKDRFGAYLATGIVSIIAIQVLINVAVVTGSIPPTGLPLPFISAGSSSLIVFMCSIGLLLNISNSSSKSNIKLLESFENEKMKFNIFKPREKIPPVKVKNNL